MNETNIAGKLEIANTYLKDQDQDINNIELMQSKMYQEVQDMRSELEEYKVTTGSIFGLIGVNIVLSVIILVVAIKSLFSKKHRKE